MRLEHINLVITNLDRSLAFYRAAFPQWHVRTQAKGEWHGKRHTSVHCYGVTQRLGYTCCEFPGTHCHEPVRSTAN